MPKQPSYMLRVQLAAMASEMPGDLRHLIHVLAVLSTSATGVGTHSQETIAKRMGVTDRHVRSLMKRLEEPNALPVRLERRARFRPEGRGRTSDEWRLVLVGDQAEQHSGKSDDQPEQRAGGTNGLTGTTRTTNRNNASDQPEQHSGDLRSDLRSDLNIGHSRTNDGTKPRTKKTSNKKTPNPFAGPLRNHYLAEYERTQRTKPVFTKGQAIAATKALGELRDLLGLDGAKAVIDNALRDEFNKTKQRRLMPWHLVSDVNKWRAPGVGSSHAQGGPRMFEVG